MSDDKNDTIEYFEDEYNKGEPIIKIDGKPIDSEINKLIFGEKIYVPLNPKSKNRDVREFTLFLLRITNSPDLDELYTKILSDGWRETMQKIFQVGRDPRDKMEIKRDTELPNYGYKPWYISVTLKVLIHEDPDLRSVIDEIILKTFPLSSLSVVNFVFFNNPQIILDDRSLFLEMLGYVYLDKIVALQEKKKIEDSIDEFSNNNPVLYAIETKIVNKTRNDKRIYDERIVKELQQEKEEKERLKEQKNEEAKEIKKTTYANYSVLIMLTIFGAGAFYIWNRQ